MYLPLTAVLEGHLFLQPAGYLEGERDVIRLAPTVEDVKKQEGYITCQPKTEGDGLDERLPLHFCLRVIPAQVRAEGQPKPACVPLGFQMQSIDIGSVCCSKVAGCAQGCLQGTMSALRITHSFTVLDCKACTSAGTAGREQLHPCLPLLSPLKYGARCLRACQAALVSLQHASIGCGHLVPALLC